MKLPSPPVDSLIGRWTGHALQLYQNRFKFILSSMQKFGSLVEFRYMKQRVVLISSPSIMEYIFKDTQSQFTRRTLGYRKFEMFIGKGSLTLEGPEWLKRRKVNQPYFNSQHLNSYLKDFQKILSRRFQSLDLSKDIDLKSFTSLLTIDFINSALFGVNLEDVQHKLVKLLDEIAHIAEYTISKTFDFPLPQDYFINRRCDKVMAELRMVIKDIVKGALSSRKDNFVKALMKGSFTQEEVEEEVRTMIIAGFETSATTLTWAIHKLIQHPEWQDKILAEYHAHYEGLSKSTDLNELKSTRIFLMEVLRFYSPVWSTSRKASSDVLIGDLQLYQGDLVLIGPYMSHHNPKNFKSPGTFDPGRFISNGEVTEPEGYFPFGHGQRMCIGKNMAMTTLTMTLSALIGHFKLAGETREVEFHPSITLRPRHSIKVQLSLRE